MRFVLVAVWLALSAPAWGWKAPGKAYVRSQVSGWLDLVDEEDLSQNRFGGRYLPELSLSGLEVKGIAVDGELELGGGIGGLFHSPGGGTDAYRVWARFSQAQWEARVGLQKINFGTATLLRPLRWFDRIDPRDPLGLTRGVWGMLGRYYLLNNANLWLWMVRADGGTGGANLLSSEYGSWELGGRGQMPAGSGEIGVTAHARKVAAGRLFSGEIFGGFPEDEKMRETILDLFAEQYPAVMDYFADGVLTEEGLAAVEAASEPFREWRLGLDGRWDWEIGLWMEGMVMHQDAPRPLFRYVQMMTVGADYTLAVGSGLHVLGEHLVSRLGEELIDGEETRHVSALSTSYRPGMLDRLSAFLYYDWEEADLFRFVSWGRTYDDWSLYINGFWNPATSPGLLNGGGDVPAEGKGIQLMVVYNHGMSLWGDE